MRLTLRTLMAYHHGVLSPADKEDLHHRIQQNEDAGKLLRRIDALTRRSQLLSPPLRSKTLDNDLGNVNSVAEYLDDALKGPKVPELERICLESDVHLAELAHCHELLATAMHTQVTVPTTLRQTAINIRDPKLRPAIEDSLLTRSNKKMRPATAGPRAGDNATTEGAVQVPAPMVASGGESIRPEGLSLEGAQLSHEVPEYLVGSARGRWKIPVAIAALTVLLGLLLWQTLGPWERVQNLLTATPTAPEKMPPEEVGEPPLVIREEIPEQAEPDDTVFHELVISEETPPVPATDDPPPTSEPLAPVDTSDEAPPIPGQSPPSSDDPQPIDTSDDGPPIPSGPPSDDAPAVDEAVWNPIAANRQNLFAAKDGELTPILSGGSIAADAQLVLGPSAQGEIHFPNGMNWTVGGLTRMTLQAAENVSVEGNLGITMDLGRGLFKAPPGKSLELACPLGNFTIQPGDENSLVSVEVGYRRIAHGSILDRRAYVPVLVIIAAEGTAKIEEKGSADDPTAKSFSLAIGEGFAAIEDKRSVKFRLAQIPNWFRPNRVRPIDVLAQKDLASLLDAGEPIVEQLEQLANNWRPETAALAIQTAMLAGNWKPFTESLLTSEQFRSHWFPTLEMARQLLAIDPTNSEPLRDLMMAKFGVKQGGELFQLLVGLPEDQLVANGISNLIAQLDSDVLANRILAFFQLQSLTGMQFAYQPYAPNRASISQWRREAAMKRLPLVATEPIYESK